MRNKQEMGSDMQMGDMPSSEMFGNKIRFHHTLVLPTQKNRTSGLYPSEGEALAGKKEHLGFLRGLVGIVVSAAGQSAAEEAKEWESAVPTELGVGQYHLPVGSKEPKFHGVTDGAVHE